jgi:hypothetical protein
VSNLTTLNKTLQTNNETKNENKNKDDVKNVKPKAKGKKHEKVGVTNSNDASSGFSINAISDSESD